MNFSHLSLLLHSFQTLDWTLFHSWIKLSHHYWHELHKLVFICLSGHKILEPGRDVISSNIVTIIRLVEQEDLAHTLPISGKCAIVEGQSWLTSIFSLAPIQYKTGFANINDLFSWSEGISIFSALILFKNPNGQLFAKSSTTPSNHQPIL